MDIEGKYTFQAPIEQVWNALLDPEVLAKSLPGVENMRVVGPDTYEATMHVGVAAVKGTYSGKVAIMDKQAPSQYHLQAEGSGTRGFVKADGTIDLAQQNGNTIASYKGSAQLGGAIAGVGMRVLPGVAKMMINQFFGAIADELRTHQELAAQPAAQPTPQPAAQPAAAQAMPAATSSAAQPAPATIVGPKGSITLPPIRQAGPVIQLVRRLRLSDGSAEDEQRWAKRLVLGAAGGVLGIALLGFLLGRRFTRKS